MLSCAGVTRQAAFNVNQMMVETERKMMDAADEVILAADHTKFGKRSVVELAALDAFDRIVTDDGCDEQTRAWLNELPAEVIYARRPGD